LRIPAVSSNPVVYDAGETFTGATFHIAPSVVTGDSYRCCHAAVNRRKCIRWGCSYNRDKCVELHGER
jgi:hypothetical protein